LRGELSCLLPPFQHFEQFAIYGQLFLRLRGFHIANVLTDYPTLNAEFAVEPIDIGPLER
jgi:hypothetical protein